MLKKTILLAATMLLNYLSAQLQPLDPDFAVPKSFVSIAQMSWKMPARGLRSIPISLNLSDTISYTIVRERGRNVAFTIENAKTQLIDTMVNQNMLTGGGIVKEAGTYLFKIKNRSFLGNTIFLEIKKNGPKIENLTDKTQVDVKKDFSGLANKPQIMRKDTLMVAYDSVHYIACSFNLKQPSAIPLPLDSIDAYHYFVVKSSNIALLNGNKQPISLKSCEDIMKPSEVVKNKAEIIIYACDKKLSVKLLKNYSCTLQLPIGTLALNEDKVVGKSLHVQILKLRSVSKPNTP